MTLLDQIYSLADDDRVELRQKVGGCWQIHSYPAKELKALVMPCDQCGAVHHNYYCPVPNRKPSTGPGIFGGNLSDLKEAPEGIDPYNRHLAGSFESEFETLYVGKPLTDWERYDLLVNGKTPFNIPEGGTGIGECPYDGPADPNCYRCGLARADCNCPLFTDCDRTMPSECEPRFGGEWYGQPKRRSMPIPEPDPNTPPDFNS